MSAQAGARRTRLATPRTASFLAAGVVVLIAALPVAGVLTGQTHRFDASTLKTVFGLLVVVLVVGAVGLVVARHQPGNPIGWLLLPDSQLDPAHHRRRVIRDVRIPLRSPGHSAAEPCGADPG